MSKHNVTEAEARASDIRVAQLPGGQWTAFSIRHGVGVTRDTQGDVLDALADLLREKREKGLL